MDTTKDQRVIEHALAIGNAVVNLLAQGADKAGFADKAAMVREFGPVVVDAAIAETLPWRDDPEASVEELGLKLFEAAGRTAIEQGLSGDFSL